jgi:hypothetical protein
MTAVPWLKVLGALPAIALIGGGIALTARPDSAPDSNAVVASKHAPATVVPDGTPAIPTAPAPPSADPSAAATPQTPGLVPPKVPVPGSSTPLTMNREGIPVTKPARAGDGNAAPGRPGSILPNVPRQPPAVARRASSPGSSARPVPARPVPARPSPAPPNPAPPNPAPPNPTPPSPTPPSVTEPTPEPPSPTSSVPAESVPASP